KKGMNNIGLQFIQSDLIIQCVTTEIKSEKKIIINNASGQFKSGELTAIMGTSGAGKSSLLHILTGFIDEGVEGNIRCNGTLLKKGSGEFRKEACYIMQENYLQQLFTVNELMMISTNLKLGNSLSLKAKQLLISSILGVMGLSTCNRTRCNKLSGGEAKRLSIALELVDNPPIMFLDEPTTGLDSVASLQCTKLLKSLAHAGRTIVCTIHQPCASILKMFDHVYILDKGECTYQGASFNILPFLRQLGLECPQYHNPADFMLEVVTGQHGDYSKKLILTAKNDIWRKPQINTGNQIRETQAQNMKRSEKIKALVLIQPPREIEQFWILLKCFYMQLHRDWTISHLRIAIHLFCGVIFGVFFDKSGSDASKTISNLSFLYVLLVYLTYTSMMPAVLKFPTDRNIVTKENFNNWYKLRTYFAAVTISSLPIQFVYTLIPVTLGYFLSSQPTDMFRYGKVLLILYVSTYTSEGVGLFLGSLCQPVMGTFYGALFCAFMVVFGGFLIFFHHIPIYLYWLTYINYFSYTFDALVTAVYGYNRDSLICPDTEIYCHLRDPEVILKEINISGKMYWYDTGMLILFSVGVRVISYCALKYKMTKISDIKL
ncbi:hypothetical protein L9F63_022848, partial [Diploptera punctata]